MGAEGPLVGPPVFKTDGDGAPVLVCSIRTRPRQLRTALSARGSAGAGGSSLPTATHCAAVGGCAALRMRRAPCGYCAGLAVGGRPAGGHMRKI